MRLYHLPDKILLADTKNLARAEREATVHILHHLREIDRRKLYCDLKCTSLFDYCVRELGYTESSAQRRIVAARLLAEIPELETKIETGSISLTNISQVNTHFKDSPTEIKVEVLKEVEGLSKKDCEKKLFEISGKTINMREQEKRVAKDKVQVALILSDETMDLMEEVKNLLGKELSTDEFLQFALRTTKTHIEAKKFKQTKERTSLPLAEVKRYVPAKVKREVYKRDQKCVNCGSRRNLNFDHRKPFALGGTSELKNIRILCFHCNQRARLKMKLGNAPPYK